MNFNKILKYLIVLTLSFFVLCTYAISQETSHSPELGSSNDGGLNSELSLGAETNVETNKVREPASWIEEPNEDRVIEMAKRRMYPGGQDEQDLEVQKQLQKPQKSPGSTNEGGSEAPVKEEEF